MPFYASDEQLYQTLQVLFERLRLQTPNPIDQLANVRLLVRLRFKDPIAEIVVNGRTRPVTLHYGDGSSTLRADLEAELSCDTLHRILTHDLALKSAIANRQMKVVGPIRKTNSLAAILEEGRNLYPAVLKDQGLI